MSHTLRPENMLQNGANKVPSGTHPQPHRTPIATEQHAESPAAPSQRPPGSPTDIVHDWEQEQPCDHAGAVVEGRHSARPGWNIAATEDEPSKRDQGNSTKLKNCDLEHHLKVDRGDPLCLGTAVHMLGMAIRCFVVKDRGFLYPSVNMAGANTSYISESFVLKHFAAVLKINLGKLEGFPKPKGLVNAPLFQILSVHAMCVAYDGLVLCSI
jgi:hypothetical protein